MGLLAARGWCNFNGRRLHTRYRHSCRRGTRCANRCTRIAYGVTVSISSLNDEREGGSSLLSVDESDNTLLLACPSDWLSIMDSDDSDDGDGSIMVACVYEDSKIQFQAPSSEAVDLDGVS